MIFRSTHRIFAAGLASILLVGCGNQYRPVVTATNPVGPAQQPQKYAVVISNPGTTTSGAQQQGLVTFVDVSGDTIITSPSIQTNPNWLALGNSGSTGYTINSLGLLDYFGTANPSSLITSNIVQTTLSASINPTTLSAISVGSTGLSLFIPETGSSKVAALNSSAQLVQEISVGTRPVYVVGADGTSRVYVINNGDGVTNGSASAIESSTSAGYSVSATIPVGVNPVYGVMSPSTQRAFILNKGSQSVSVINEINNAPDAYMPTIALPTKLVGGFNVASNPVWADYSAANNELVVLSAGDGTHPGSVSIIDTTLCSAVAQPTNPNCSTSNPVDATTFGTVYATVPVGINPTMVAVLKDGSRAYVVNQLDSTGLCTPGQGSVSVVNLTSNVVTSTICGSADNVVASTPTVFGHPTTLAVTSGTPTGKVFVTSPDSKQLTIIYTDTDTVYTHVPLFGSGVKVLVTQP